MVVLIGKNTILNAIGNKLKQLDKSYLFMLRDLCIVINKK